MMNDSIGTRLSHLTPAQKRLLQRVRDIPFLHFETGMVVRVEGSWYPHVVVFRDKSHMLTQAVDPLARLSAAVRMHPDGPASPMLAHAGTRALILEQVAKYAARRARDRTDSYEWKCLHWRMQESRYSLSYRQFTKVITTACRLCGQDFREAEKARVKRKKETAAKRVLRAREKA